MKSYFFLPDIDVLSLTWHDVSRVGVENDIILKDGSVIHYHDFELLSEERSHCIQLKQDYFSSGMPHYTVYNEDVEKKNHRQYSKSVFQLLIEPDLPQPYLLEGLIPRGEFIGIVGKSGVNKSTFCRQLSLWIATCQRSFLGFRLTSIHQHSLYIYSEDGENWLRKYLRMNCEGISHNRDQLQNMKIANMNDFENCDCLLEYLREEITIQSFDLIVFDSFSDLLNLFGAKLNDNADVRKAIKRLEFLKANDCTVLFNHHISDKSSSLGTFLGATAFKQVVRTLLEITEKDSQRIISVEKNSYGEKFDPMVFNLTENFLFESTGETITRAELSELAANSNHYSPKPVGKPKIAPCTIDTTKLIFGDSNFLTTAEIKNRLGVQFILSDKTCERWISDVTELGFIKKSKRGEYILVEQSISTPLYNNIDGNIDDFPEHIDNTELIGLQEFEPSISQSNIDGKSPNDCVDEIHCEPDHELNKPFKYWEEVSVKHE